jgi:hypothetical protein
LYTTTMLTSSIIPVYGYAFALYVTLGNNSPFSPIWTAGCLSSNLSLVSGPYRGAVDEFRLYNRELDSQEICVLANV